MRNLIKLLAVASMVLGPEEHHQTCQAVALNELSAEMLQDAKVEDDSEEDNEDKDHEMVQVDRKGNSPSERARKKRN